MKSSFKAIIILLAILYPFIIFIGIKSLSLKYIGLLIALLFCLRLMVIKKESIVWKAVCVIGIILATIASIMNNLIVIQLYPVFVNLTLFSIFTYSLFQKSSIITRFAQRVSKHHLPAYAVKYTWYVTFSWCVFFLCNALISILTILSKSIQIWTLYNGFISYLLIGLLATIELIIRFFIRRYFEKQT